METNVQSSQLIEKEVSSETTFVAMHSDLPVNEIVFLNNTGVDIDIRQDNGDGTEGVVYTCLDGTYYIVDGIVNANQVMVKLNVAGDAVMVQARYFA